MCRQGPGPQEHQPSEQPSPPETGPPPRRIFVVPADKDKRGGCPPQGTGEEERPESLEGRARSGSRRRQRSPSPIDRAKSRSREAGQREAREEKGTLASIGHAPSAKPLTPGRRTSPSGNPASRWRAQTAPSKNRAAVATPTGGEPSTDPRPEPPPDSKEAHPGAAVIWKERLTAGGDIRHTQHSEKPQHGITVSLGELPQTGSVGWSTPMVEEESHQRQAGRSSSKGSSKRSAGGTQGSRPAALCDETSISVTTEEALPAAAARSSTRSSLVDPAAAAGASWALRRCGSGVESSAADPENCTDSHHSVSFAKREEKQPQWLDGHCICELGSAPPSRPGQGPQYSQGVVVELGTLPWDQAVAEFTRSESSALSSTLSTPGQVPSLRRNRRAGLRRSRGQSAPPAEPGRGTARAVGSRIRRRSGQDPSRAAAQPPGEKRHIWLQGTLEMRAIDLFQADRAFGERISTPKETPGSKRLVQRISGILAPIRASHHDSSGWRKCHVVLGPDGLAFWPPGIGPQSGQAPEGAFRFAELADVTTSGVEINLKFKTKQDDASDCNGDSLVLRANNASLAQRWGAAVRSAIAAKLVANLPADWDVNAIATSSKFVSKQPLSQEITSVFQRLVDYCFVCKTTRDRRRKEMPLRLQVTEVVRVENSVAWIAYDEARARLVQHRTASGPFKRQISGKEVMTSAIDDDELSGILGTLDEELQEQWLFHGTTSSAIQGISDSHFRLDLAGSRRGTMYGNGVYLAECSSKADEYAEADPDGVCRILLCRALLGRVLKNIDKRPKGRELEAECRARYDSLLGDREAAVGTFREFVLFDSSQVYPAYIVHYKRVMQPEFLRQIVEGPYAPLGDDILYAARLAEEHPDSVVRYRILLLLGNSAGKVVPTLVSFLNDERTSCRRIVASVLRQLASSLAPPDAASEAVGAICMATAVPALQKTSQKDRDAEVRELAATAVQEIKRYPT